MGDPRVGDGDRRWRVLYLHHEREELCLHYRATIPRETTGRVVLDLLASGRLPPMQLRLPASDLRRSSLLIQRFWGTIREHEAERYLTLFLNDRCLVLPLGTV